MMNKNQQETVVYAVMLALLVITGIALLIAIMLDAHQTATNIAVVLALLGLTSSVFTIYYTLMD